MPNIFSILIQLKHFKYSYSAQCQTFQIFLFSSVSNILFSSVPNFLNILSQLSVKPPKLGDLKNADLKNSYTFHATLPNQAGTILIAFDHLIFQVAWCNDDLGTKFSRFFTEGIQQSPPINIELLDEFINRRYDLSWSFEYQMKFCSGTMLTHLASGWTRRWTEVQEGTNRWSSWTRESKLLLDGDLHQRGQLHSSAPQ